MKKQELCKTKKKKRTKLLKAETNYQMISLIYNFLLIQEMGNDIRHIIIFNFAIFNPFYVYGIIHIRKHAGKNILHYVHSAKEMTSSPFFNRFKFHKYSVVLSYMVIWFMSSGFLKMKQFSRNMQ